MIGWIVAFSLIAFAAFIILRAVIRMARGTSGCSGCPGGGCSGCPHRQDAAKTRRGQA